MMIAKITIAGNNFESEILTQVINQIFQRSYGPAPFVAWDKKFSGNQYCSLPVFHFLMTRQPGDHVPNLSTETTEGYGSC